MTDHATAPTTDATVTLHDGRTVGYAEYGDPRGAPLFHFHGHPGSRLEAALLHEPARDAGVRLIGTDRPGMGHSDPHRRRTILDWSGDVAQVADALGLERFAVQGISGGGPYAAACAYALADRVSACTLIASAGPTGLGTRDGELAINRLQRRLVRFAPWLLDLGFAQLGRSITRRAMTDGPEAVTAAALAGLPEIDRDALADARGARRYGLALVEAFRQGARGPAWEARLLSRPWGFALEQITIAEVHVWHGALDQNVSIETGAAMAHAIPHARGHFHADEGHISVAVNHAADILSAVRP